MKRVPHATSSVALVSGNASVEGGSRERRTTVYGAGHEFPEVFSFDVALGEFLPADDPRAPRALAVLGSKLRDELFGSANPIGERIRVGGDRYRVIGVMASKGNMLGFDLDDTVYIPAARALELFNREGLMEIDVLYRAGASVEEVVAGVKRTLIARHGGEDFTITTQQQMMDVMGSVLGVVTFAVSALGGISLLVGGVGIFTIMTIAVRDRTPEIGLLRAVGAPTSQIHALFLTEAVVLSTLGGLVGLAFGAGVSLVVDLLVPSLPVQISPMYVLVAGGVAVAIGLVAGVVPAHRASTLDPLAALASE
jgi:putative ABC transport system permease protein